MSTPILRDERRPRSPLAYGTCGSVGCAVVEVADGLVVQVLEGDRDDVVATDDARFLEAMLDTEFDL